MMGRWAKVITLTVVAALALFAVLEPRLSSDAEPVRDAALPGADAAVSSDGGSDTVTEDGGTSDVAAAAATAAPEDPAVSALDELQKRLEADSTDVEAWRLLGSYFLSVQDYPRAAEAFAAVLEFDEEDAQARADLGMALLYQGLVRVARANLIQALELDDALVEAHLNLGITYSHASPANLGIAREQWERVIELAPESDLASQAEQYLETYVAAATEPAADAARAE